tara:strand:+ start:543 stop:1031 length:489 start_codon:yes stop_codon:yes gene_type:complete
MADTYYDGEQTFGSKAFFYDNAKFEGGLNLESSANVKEIFEKVCAYDRTSYSEIKIDVGKGSLHNYTKEATSDFTFNIQNKSMPVGRSIVITILINMGSSAYVLLNPSTTGFKINDKAVVVKWINSTAPTSGFTNAVNTYTFAIIKNAAEDYTVLGTLSSFG